MVETPVECEVCKPMGLQHLCTSWNTVNSLIYIDHKYVYIHLYDHFVSDCKEWILPIAKKLPCKYEHWATHTCIHSHNLVHYKDIL